MLKHPADRKSVAFASAMTGLLVWNWSQASLHWLPFALACFGAICVTSMVHNHVHVRMFRSPALNVVYDYWLTVFYGYPVFAWISTHNKNHHVYNNRDGDFAPSYLHSEKNNLFTLLAYPTVSGSVQQKVNLDYLKVLWTKDRAKCVYYVSQFAFLIGFILGALALDWRKALLYVVLPEQIALNGVLMLNYLQHIHCDEQSKFNHSRNFVGRSVNFFLFNNGYHTAHHLKPLMHWSDLKAQHAKIAHEIDERCNESNFIWAMVRMYVLVPFFPRLRGVNMRASRMDLERKARSEAPEPALLLPPGIYPVIEPALTL